MGLCTFIEKCFLSYRVTELLKILPLFVKITTNDYSRVWGFVLVRIDIDSKLRFVVSYFSLSLGVMYILKIWVGLKSKTTYVESIEFHQNFMACYFPERELTVQHPLACLVMILSFANFEKRVYEKVWFL